MNTTKLGMIFGLMAVAVLSGCSKEIEVSGELPGFEIPQGNSSGRSTEGKTYENAFGSVRFAQVDANTIQVFRTCTSSSYCQALNQEISASYELKLNDASSTYHYPRTDGSRAVVTATGSLTNLTLTTVLSAKMRTEETFTLSDNPCEENDGSGLQVIRKSIQVFSGGSSETETCISYR